MRKNFLLAVLLLAVLAEGRAEQVVEVVVSNTQQTALTDEPVVIGDLPSGEPIRSATVTRNGKEIACQIDDLDGDGKPDELCFLTDIGGHERQTFRVVFSATKAQASYQPRVFAEMLLRNPKVKAKNRHDLFIQSLTAERGSNLFPIVHHHGPAFESELVAFRIYFDHRQTVDLYGKYHRRLELRETQFYPDKQQLADGYGDDILWGGNSFGLGALRGWDGSRPVMLDNVERRTERILAYGPLRTVVEIVDCDWDTGNAGKPHISMTTRYTLFAGHRDCIVDVRLDGDASDYRFSTGITRIKDSEEFSDGRGLRGCWGTNWAVAMSDTAGHHPETLGMGILIPSANIVSELPADDENYPFVVKPSASSLRYFITFCSANEEQGFRSAASWFDDLKKWKSRVLHPLSVSVGTVGKHSRTSGTKHRP